jgi:hypothetical protein
MHPHDRPLDTRAEPLLGAASSAPDRAVRGRSPIPGVATASQFNADSLKTALQGDGVAYLSLGDELGGRRRPRPDSPHIGPDGGDEEHRLTPFAIATEAGLVYPVGGQAPLDISD